jgi:hypothetical protein
LLCKELKIVLMSDSNNNLINGSRISDAVKGLTPSEEEALEVKKANRKAKKAEKADKKAKRVEKCCEKNRTATPVEREGLESKNRLESFVALVKKIIKYLRRGDDTQILLMSDLEQAFCVKSVEDLESLLERFESHNWTITKIQLKEIWYDQLGNIIEMIPNEKMKNGAKAISNEFKTKKNKRMLLVT